LYELNINRESPDFYMLAAKTAMKGNLASVIWLQDHFETSFTQAFVFSYTAQCHQLHILDWLFEKYGHKTVHLTINEFLGGGLPLAQWAYNKGYPLNKDVCFVAMAAGNLPLLVWATNLGCPWPPGLWDCLLIFDCPDEALFKILNWAYACWYIPLDSFVEAANRHPHLAPQLHEWMFDHGMATRDQ
jgi:hypothetical protein